MHHSMKAAILGATICVTASIASAATVTIDSSPFRPGALVEAASITGTVNQNVTGDIPNERKSPWGATKTPDAAFTSVQMGSSATYKFDTARTSIDLLWGTPDTYNFIDFLLGDAMVDSIGGGDTGIADFADQTTNQFVTVTASALFDTVVYRSTTSNAFEFATVAPVPLPAAGLLLIGALGGMAALRRRRRI